MLSVEEAARALGISRGLAYELVARGELPHLRLGRRIVVPRIALQALLARAVEPSWPPADLDRPPAGGPIGAGRSRT
ncbi:MAG: helix-turn-helix domain-containing protein [Acidimicrobiales bacterium]